MRKKYSSKTARIGAALCALLFVACGLKITKVTLSADEISQGGEVTVTTQFERADGDYDNNSGIYLLYAVRVPSDWSYTEALEAVSSVYSGDEDAEPATDKFDFEECSAYAALAQFCYPKADYKWIGFQTTEQVTLTCNQNGKDNVKATLTLKAGETIGDFKLDIISGSFPHDPSTLVKADGSVDVDVAFGRKSDFAAADPKKLSDGTEVFGFSEYLVNASTISAAEQLAAENTLLSYTATIDGKSYPISAGADIGNVLTDEELAGLQLNVKVVKDTSTAIDEITVSEEDNSPVYNLNGVKVAEPTAPGIYIKNGKKFIVK